MNDLNSQAGVTFAACASQREIKNPPVDELVSCLIERVDCGKNYVDMNLHWREMVMHCQKTGDELFGRPRRMLLVFCALVLETWLHDTCRKAFLRQRAKKREETTSPGSLRVPMALKIA